MNVYDFINKHLLLIVFLTAIVCGVTPISAEVPDFNDNGTADLVFTSETSDGSLNWTAFDVSSGEKILLGEFGEIGNITNIGFWTGNSVPDRLVARVSSSGVVDLYLDTIEQHISLAPPRTNNAILLLGHDIDDSGLADAAVVVQRGKKFSWRLALDPFGELSERRVVFGKSNGVPFLYTGRGNKKYLGTIHHFEKRASKVVSRQARARRQRRIRLRGITSEFSDRPLLVKGNDGRDSFGFVREQGAGTEVVIVNHQGRLNEHTILIGSGEVIAADIYGTGSDQLGLINAGKFLTTVEGNVELLTNGSSPVGTDTAERIEREDLEQTPTPTAIVTATFTATATSAPTATVTHTPTPTATVTATFTATATSTPTATATHTPTPTATVTATFTATATSTPTAIPQTEHRIFVSSTTSWGFAGSTYYDTECQTLADTQSLGGTWIALISKGGWGPKHFARFFDRTLRNMNGEVVAQGETDLWDGTIQAAINYDESGVLVPSGQVWTGSDSTGENIGGENCADWYSTSNKNGRYGDLSATDGTWIEWNAHSCYNGGLRVYCFESTP